MGLVLVQQADAVGPEAWARQEFGRARLGDARRTQSAVALAELAAHAPHGRLTQLEASVRQKRRGYALLENPHVSPMQLARAAWEAAAWRAAALPYLLPYLIVALDQTSLTLTDTHRAHGTGPVGQRRGGAGARGFECMSALGLLPHSGECVGLLGQAYWARSEAGAGAAPTRCLEDKETRHWLHVGERVLEALAARAPHLRAWLQMDRGADFWELLTWADAQREHHWVSVRAAQDRRCVGPEDAGLWATAEAAPVLVRHSVQVPARHGALARWAHVQVHACDVLVQLKDRQSGQTGAAHFFCVLVQEVGCTGPAPDRPLHWLLLTTRPVLGPQDALEVLAAYTQRWRVEDFHRAWKGGACCVEDTQLRSSRAILTWATILASVAARAEALKVRSREEPDAPATDMLSVAELRATLLLAREPDASAEAARALTLLDAVVLIGTLGGWMGQSAGNPPGTQVLTRGLERVLIAAQALEAYEALHPPK